MVRTLGSARALSRLAADREIRATATLARRARCPGKRQRHSEPDTLLRRALRQACRTRATSRGSVTLRKARHDHDQRCTAHPTGAPLGAIVGDLDAARALSPEVILALKQGL